MLGDVLLIEDKHTRAAEQILEKLLELPGEKKILAVGGESGSGKTEIAHQLARMLKARGTPAKIMHIDNYYLIPPVNRKTWRKEHGIGSIGYTEYDWDLINRNIQEFKEDQDQVIMPCIDLLTDQIDQLHTSFQGLQYLIIEGLYAVKAEADLKVFIDISYHDTKDMQYDRGKEPVNDYRWQVLEREHQVMCSIRPLTDLILNAEYNLEALT